MPKTVVNAGNFKNGMVPDVIGARDSVVDLVDGWIDRDGEIRKRGKKDIFFHPTNSLPVQPDYPTATIFNYRPTSMLAISSDVRGKSSVATTIVTNNVLQNYWNMSLYRPATLPPTIPSDDGFVEFGPTPYGGGWGMKAWQNIIVSPRRQSSPNNGVWELGIWGGGKNTTALALGNGTLSVGSPIVTGGVAFDVNLTAGDWIQVSLNAEYFRVEEIISPTSIRLDRIPNSIGGVQALQRVPCVRPFQVLPANLTYSAIAYPTATSWSPRTAQVVCEHQSRLFLANFDGLPSGLGWSATPSESPVRTGLFGATFSTMPIDAYFEDSFALVGSSDSGEITGMHSLGEQLVILKTDGIYALRGQLSTIGLPTGASIDLIVPDSGCAHFESSCISRMGVVWGNSEGLWVYSGSSIRNLTDGVVGIAWDRVIGGSPVVSAINNRIVAQNKDTGACLIYHIDGGYFTRQDTSPSTNLTVLKDAGYGNGASFVTTGATEYPIGTSVVPSLNLSNPALSHFHELNWGGDEVIPTYTDGISSVDFSKDNLGLDTPRLRILTQPLDPGYPFTDSRMNQVLVSGFMRSAEDILPPPYPPAAVSPGPALPASMSVSLVDGRARFIDELEPHLVNEYKFIPDELDTTQRFGVAGNRSTPSTRILLEEINDTENDLARDIGIYGIGAEFLEDNTVGNDT